MRAIRVLDAIALGVSTTIGAGVLALPRALYDAGILGIPASFLVAFFLFLSASMLNDMLKRENKPVQLTSLISEILGPQWKYITYFTLIFSMYGALTAYLIGFGDQVGTIFPLPQIFGGLLLFFLASYAIWRGTKVVGNLDAILSVFLILFLLSIALINFSKISSLKMTSGNFDSLSIFIGTMVFALFGLNVFPEMNYLAKGKGLRAFAISTLICLSLYLLFALSTSSLLGEKTTELGTKALAIYYGGTFEIFISLFTLIALFTSFMGIGISLRHIYTFDFNLSRAKAFLLTVFPPLLLFLISESLGIGFLSVLSTAGELTLPLFLISLSYAYLKSYPALETSLPFPKHLALLSIVFYSFIFFSFFFRVFPFVF